MDKKSVVRRKRFDYQAKARCALITGVVLGLLLICYSGIQLYGYRKDLGEQTQEELTSDMEKYAEEVDKYNAEKEEEYEKNGSSDKYFELSQKATEASVKYSNAGQSVYMRDTGYHNPRNLWELIITVPLLFVGILCIAAGIVARSVIKEKGKKAKTEEKN